MPRWSGTLIGRVPAVLGAAAALLGLVVIAGWHLHLPRVIQLHTDMAPMPYNAALAFALAGAALAALALGRGALAGIAAGVAAVLGLVTLGEYLLGVEGGIDQWFMQHFVTTRSSHPGRMAPAAALGFVLIGTAVVLVVRATHSDRRRYLAGILAGIVLALAAAAFLGYLTDLQPLFRWGGGTDMAVTTAIGQALAASGLLLWLARQESRAGRHCVRWAGLVVFSLALAMTLLLWSGLVRHENENRQSLLAAEARTLADRIETLFRNEHHALDRMARRWESEGGTPPARWRTDAAAYVRDLVGLRAVEWVDAGGTIRWIEPARGNEDLVGTHPARAPARVPLLDQARWLRQPVISPPMALAPGGSQVHFFRPLYIGERFDGYIVADFDLSTIFRHVVEAERQTRQPVLIEHGGKPVYRNAASDVTPAAASAFDLPVWMANESFRLRIGDGGDGLDHRSLLPWVVLAGGVCGAFLLAAIFWLWGLSLRRAEEAEAASAALADSEQKFRQLYEFSPVGIALNAMDGRDLEGNRALARMVGYSEDELGRLSYRDLAPRENEPQEAQQLEALRRRGAYGPFEKEFVRKDGSRVPVLLNGVVIRDRNGRERIWSIVQDIGVRKQAEDALRRQQQALRALNEIAAIPLPDPQEQLRQALALGARYFGLDLGIIARIEGDRYTVRVQSSPPGTLADGATFALGDTYCSITLGAADVVAIARMSESAHAGHPCYRRLALESYIGAPLRVGGRAYGTVNFSSAVARAADFDAAEREFMRLLARWIGATIERDQATSRLRESEQRWQFALEGSGDGIWDWNVQTDKVFFSRRWKEMLGYGEQEIGDTLEERNRRVHPDDMAACQEDLDRHIRGETPVYVNEHRMRCKDGGYKWILDRGQVIERSPDGQPLRVIGTHSDISERRQTVADLDRIKRLLDDTHDSIFMFDPDTLRFVYLNRGAVESMGYTHAELLELTPYRLKPLLPEPLFRARIAPLLTGEKTVLNFETVHRRKDGSEFPVDVLLQLVHEHGRRGVFVAIVRDITARKQVERLKNEFVSTVSHELRTPLTSIRGALGLLEGGAAGELPEKGRELVQIAHRNAQRLSRLINDILDIEKIASGKMPFDLRPYSLMSLVEQAVAANRSYAEQHGVRVAISARLGPAEVRVDAGRFQQVMDNLLSNAAKFSPAGATVEVAVERRPDHLQVAISDRGPGIPAEFRARLFEKFSQVDASDTRARGGSGLGLAISREIVERMGGRIGFDTEEGVGTTFRVEFPHWREASPAAPAPHAGALP